MNSNARRAGTALLAALALGGRPLPSAPVAGGTLRLSIVERDGGGRESPLPARVHLRDPQGKPVEAPGLPFFRDHFNCDGGVSLELSPGRYSFTVERGPEYRRASGEVDVRAGEAGDRKVVLERWIDLARDGWWSGELHVHRPVEAMPLLLRSEDLHVAPVITVWNKGNLWADRPLPETLLLEAGPRRLSHVLAQEDERQGGALLYFHLRLPLRLAGDGREFPSPVSHLEEALASPGAWVDIEKPFWWDVPTWVATGKVRSIEIANNHMNRSGMYEGEAWGRPRDRARFPAPRGNGFYSQEIYYRLLNCGFRIPPAAGSASGVLPNPVGYNRVYVKLDGEFSWDGWWRGLAGGRSFVTNGPVLRVEADGRPPGEVFRRAAGERFQPALSIRAEGNDPLEALEVIRDGAVIETIRGDAFQGTVKPAKLLFERSGWFLVRAIARVSETFRFASTAPFHVEIGDRPRRVHRGDVEHFLAWIDERIARIEKSADPDLADAAKRAAVLAPHRQARDVFRALLDGAE